MNIMFREPKIQGVDWPMVSSKNFKFMNIGGPKNFKVQIDNNIGNKNFWKSINLY